MSRYQLGDLVHAAEDLFNDAVEETGEGGLPGVAAGELVVAAGTRGVVVNVGHVQELPSEEIYLVRFETGADGTLAEPVGCLADELRY